MLSEEILNMHHSSNIQTNQPTTAVRIHVNNENLSFSKLYDQYAGAVYGNITRQIKDRKKCDEILQKVFINYYKNCQENQTAASKKVLIEMLKLANQHCKGCFDTKGN